jgi:hypothetical protein
MLSRRIPNTPKQTEITVGFKASFQIQKNGIKDK